MAEHDQDDSILLGSFCENRSEAAFTELVRRHLPLVFNVALRRLNSAALAEEAAQHTFARLAAKAAAVSRHPERLGAWLHRTAYFEASTLARRESRLSRLPLPSETTSEPMNRPEIHDRLDEALSSLPELDRELVMRHCCAGEDYQRIASATGKSAAACQKRVERALARLARRLGGARTAGAVGAVLAATSAKSQAMPAAERVAAAALKQQAIAGGVTGAVSGMKVAACAALVLAGGAAGWRKSEPAPEPPAATRPVAVRSRADSGGTLAKNTEQALAPRPVPINRTLEEVLESIQADRLAPLIEFLPQATGSDLMAIIAEDDFAGFSEGSGDFGLAHDLAVQRWVEIDPKGALNYGISRDHEGSGTMEISSTMLSKWMQTDSKAAAAAFMALPAFDRRKLAEAMVQTNDAVAGKLAAIDPGVAWVVEETRIFNPAPESRKESADAVIARLLGGSRRDEPTGEEAGEIASAFWILAQTDPEDALASAELIPWPNLRARVLTSIYQFRPPASASLAPGAARTFAAASEAEQLMLTDPDAAVRRLQSAKPGAERDAIYQAVSAGLAGSDPWRLLELMNSMDGFLKGNSNDVARALEYAGRTDPQRALALLPGVAGRIDNYDGTWALAKNLLSGWLKKDPAGAIRWADKAGIWLGGLEMDDASGDPLPLVQLLADDNKQVRRVAIKALSRFVEDDLAKGTAKNLLEQMPQDAADDVLERIAVDRCHPGHFDEALRIAAMASPAGRDEKVLPQMAFMALRRDYDAAVIWLKSLPSTDQRAVITGMELMLGSTTYADDAELREALKQLNP